MWPFKKKKQIIKSSRFGPQCSFCKSTNTKVVMYNGTDQPNFVKIWRGKRYLTCKCFNCGHDFYTLETLDFSSDENSVDELIDDPEALNEAEIQLEDELEDKNDRRCH